MRSRHILRAAGFAVLVGCSDSTGTSGLSGTLTFSYSGDLSGSFSATGSIPLSGENTAPWAVGGRDDTDGAVVALASQPQSGGTYNYVIVVVPRTTVGNANIDVNCSPSATCAAVLFDIGVNDNTGTSQQTCFLDAGTVAITSISGSRAQGTFSGTGTCVSSTNVQTVINITGGAFNVALLTGVSGP